MSAVANRLFAIGVCLVFGGGAFLAMQFVNERNWDEFTAIRETDAYIARQEVRLANSPANVAKAERAEREAVMSGHDRYEANRYVAYGLGAVGAIFALVGFAMAGATPPSPSGSGADGQEKST